VKASRVAGSQHGAHHAPRDLQPEGLRLRQVEIGFIPLLGPLLPTPRAGKKLVNIYRLIRIAIPDGELPVFLGDDSGGPYQALLVLLGIMVGAPNQARPMMTMIESANPNADLIAGLRTPANNENSSSSQQRTDWMLIAGVVDDIGAATGLNTEIRHYQRWVPTVTRFSFHTRDLTG
jgi:hypothetical protein